MFGDVGESADCQLAIWKVSLVGERGNCGQWRQHDKSVPLAIGGHMTCAASLTTPNPHNGMYSETGAMDSTCNGS